MSPEIAARLANLHIELVSEAKGYCVFARDGCLALAHRSEGGGFGSLGSSGVMTEHGLTYPIWKEGRPLLAAHGGYQFPAGAAQVQTILQFSRDLKAALGLEE